MFIRLNGKIWALKGGVNRECFMTRGKDGRSFIAISIWDLGVDPGEQRGLDLKGLGFTCALLHSCSIFPSLFLLTDAYRVPRLPRLPSHTQSAEMAETGANFSGFKLQSRNFTLCSAPTKKRIIVLNLLLFEFHFQHVSIVTYGRAGGSQRGQVPIIRF